MRNFFILLVLGAMFGVLTALSVAIIRFTTSYEVYNQLHIANETKQTEFKGLQIIEDNCNYGGKIADGQLTCNPKPSSNVQEKVELL